MKCLNIKALLSLVCLALTLPVTADVTPFKAKIKSIEHVKAKPRYSVRHFQDMNDHREGLLIEFESDVRCTQSNASVQIREATSRYAIFLHSHFPGYYSSNAPKLGDIVWSERLTERFSLVSHQLNGAMLASVAVDFVHMEPASMDVGGSSVDLGPNPTVCIFNESGFKLVAPADGDSSGTDGGTDGAVVVEDGAEISTPTPTSWGFDIATAGTYSLLVHWVVNQQAVGAIAYGIDGEADKTSVTLKPSFGSGVWVDLGQERYFSAGHHTISIDVDASGPYIIDGVKVQRVP